MPAAKRKAIFVECKKLSEKEIETVLSGTDTLPWYGAVMQVIRESKADCMDLQGQCIGLNNPLGVAHGVGGMDFADNLILRLMDLCSPKPE